MLVFKELKNLFVLAYGRENDDTTENSQRKYFLPRMKIKNYNIEIDGRNLYDQSIIGLIKQYNKVRKISTWQGDDQTTGCLLNYVYFKDDFRLITTDLSEQKTLDADPKAIQQIIFTGQADDEALAVFQILEKSKETILELAKGTTRVL